MNTEITIRAWIYGLAIISNSEFVKIKTMKRIRAKKMITYFASHNDIGNYFVQQGAVIPVHNIHNYDYTIFCGNQNNNIPKEWNIIKKIGKFNLTIGEDNCFWVSQLNELEEWDNNKFNGIESLTEQVYIEGNLESVYRAVKINVAKGYYIVNIYGIKRNNPFLDEIGEQKNYGFFLELKQVNHLKEADDPTKANFLFF